MILPFAACVALCVLVAAPAAVDRRWRRDPMLRLERIYELGRQRFPSLYRKPRPEGKYDGGAWGKEAFLERNASSAVIPTPHPFQDPRSSALHSRERFQRVPKQSHEAMARGANAFAKAQGDFYAEQDALAKLDAGSFQGVLEGLADPNRPKLGVV